MGTRNRLSFNTTGIGVSAKTSNFIHGLLNTDFVLNKTVIRNKVQLL